MSESRKTDLHKITRLGVTTTYYQSTPPEAATSETSELPKSWEIHFICLLMGVIALSNLEEGPLRTGGRWQWWDAPAKMHCDFGGMALAETSIAWTAVAVH